MYLVKAEIRAADIKVKKLRKAGIIPACIYGGKLTDTLLIQLPAKEAAKLLREKTTGGQVSIDVDGKKMIALLKEISSSPLDNKTEHLSFQSLVADELVTSTAQIILDNEGSVSDVVRQNLFELSIRALPANLAEEVHIDLAGMSAGSVVRVEDLDIAKNQNIELLTNMDTMIVNVIERASVKAEEPMSDAEPIGESGEKESEALE